MSDNMITSLVTVATSIVGLAIIAVIVSNRAKTPDVIKAASSGFAGVIQAATSPVNGGGARNFNTSFTGGSPISDMFVM